MGGAGKSDFSHLGERASKLSLGVEPYSSERFALFIGMGCRFAAGARNCDSDSPAGTRSKMGTGMSETSESVETARIAWIEDLDDIALLPVEGVQK